MMYTDVKIAWKKEHPMEILISKGKKWNFKQKCSRNHIKMQKSIMFVRKNLKINMLKIKIP